MRCNHFLHSQWRHECYINPPVVVAIFFFFDDDDDTRRIFDKLWNLRLISHFLFISFFSSLLFFFRFFYLLKKKKILSSSFVSFRNSPSLLIIPIILFFHKTFHLFYVLLVAINFYPNNIDFPFLSLSKPFLYRI